MKGEARSKFEGQLKAGLMRAVVVGMLALGLISIGGQAVGAANTQDATIKVRYYGIDTTFESLFAEGKVVHCVTEMTSSLARRGRFDPAIDRVLCFDTITEADREFERMHPSIPHRDHPSSMKPAGKLASPVYQGCPDWFALYRQSSYINWWYDLCSDNPNVTEPIWSVWENGIAAMRVYKNTWYSGSSWLITESHWTLGNGWGGSIKSIDWF